MSFGLDESCKVDNIKHFYNLGPKSFASHFNFSPWFESQIQIFPKFDADLNPSPNLNFFLQTLKISKKHSCVFSHFKQLYYFGFPQIV